MYTKGFTLSIMKGNEFLREKNSHGERQVFLQFGSEYSVYLKNKTSQNAKFQVKIDGKLTAPDEEWYVIYANDNFNLERFMLDNDVNKGERFKFVNVHGSGEEAGEADNGLIEVIVKPAKSIKIKCKPILFMNKVGGERGGLLNDMEVKTKGGILDSLDSTSFGTSRCSVSYSQVVEDSFKPNDEGVTVGGSDSFQSFSDVPDFETKGEILLALRLKPLKSQPYKIPTVVYRKSDSSEVETETCKACDGEGLQTDSSGLRRYCPECGGKGWLEVHHVL